jgi:ribosomal protein S18 acetylase RimI-like enzyme
MAQNKRALSFYRNLGFSVIGVAKKQVKLGWIYYDEVYMEKFL